jgi:hypothetical protein
MSGFLQFFRRFDMLDLVLGGMVLAIVIFSVLILRLIIVDASKPEIKCKEGYVLLTRVTGTYHVCVPGYIPEQ